MNKKQPTQEQIKEFLQWCGIQCYYKDETNDNIEAWICPPDSEKTIAFYGLTLDFLFKYAVPKAIGIIMARDKCGEELAYIRLFMRWLRIGYDAPALFWVLWQVKEVEQ